MPTHRLSPTATAVAATAACLQLLAALPATAQTADRNSPACAAALQSYNNMRARTTMDEAQYAGTPEGGAVRAACGSATLANTDNGALNPVRPIVPVVPAPPPYVPPPAASAPTPVPSVPVARPPVPAPAPVPIAAPPARIISPSPAPTALPGVRPVPAAPAASR